jgi:hypothetical protein
MNRIWAVAVNTIKQALRMKIAAVFIILLFVLLPLMGFSATGDGTLKGRLQTFISYGLSLTSFLLCLLTIIMSVYALTSDLDQRQIYTVITKPIRRFQLVLGKLLGIVLLDIFLLLVFSAVIYTLTVYTPKFYGAGKEDLTKLQNEFFTARKHLVPAEADVTEEVKQTLERLKKDQQLPENVLENETSHQRLVESLTERLKLSKTAAAIGHEVIWEFYDVGPLEPNQSIFVRFKYDVSRNPPDLQVYGNWLIGDTRQIRYGTKIETPIYDFERKDLIRTAQEIEVPADAIADDGYLSVAFFNPPLNDTIVIFPPGDLSVLYKADSFTANFLRAVLLILLRLIFLACLGTLTATFLSFPVAILCCLVVLFTGTISGFVLESFEFMSQDIGRVYSYTIKPIVQLLPAFDKFSPSKFLLSGELLSWSLLARVAALLVCARSVLLALVAVLIFSRKEIAKVII